MNIMFPFIGGLHALGRERACRSLRPSINRQFGSCVFGYIRAKRAQAELMIIHDVSQG